MIADHVLEDKEVDKLPQFIDNIEYILNKFFDQETQHTIITEESKTTKPNISPP